MIKKDEKKISSSFEENIAYMDQVLPVKESFDMIKREMEIGGRKSFFYFIDGFVKDEAMLKLMDSFLSVTEEDMPEDAQAFSVKEVPYVEVEVLTDFDQVMRNVLSGTSCLFIEGYEGCLCIDCRTYPARSVDEPDKDKSLRGSRDGFVETIVFNTALMRRRIRDPHLVMEMTEAGQASRTDIAVCYMSDRVDRELLKNLKNRIESLQVGDLRMNQQSLAEALFKRKWFNPFPKFKYTERPDTAAACLLEGKVVVLVDNSPSALILPTSILDMIEEANDYYFPTWKEVREYLDGERILPDKSIVLSFDDGPLYIELAIPLFEKYQTPATSFVITSYYNDKSMLDPYRNNQYLTLESHTDNMHRGGGTYGHGGIFPALSKEEALADLKKSIEYCGNGDALAYPFGDYTAECEQTVEEAGFLCAVTTEPGKCYPGDDPYALTRVRMLGSQSLDQFISEIN